MNAYHHIYSLVFIKKGILNHCITFFLLIFILLAGHISILLNGNYRCNNANFKYDGTLSSL